MATSFDTIVSKIEAAEIPIVDGQKPFNARGKVQAIIKCVAFEAGRRDWNAVWEVSLVVPNSKVSYKVEELVHDNCGSLIRALKGPLIFAGGRRLETKAYIGMTLRFADRGAPDA